MSKNHIQDYPTSDSPNHDAFEGIVELYFEIKGYLTSSGKWFWKKSEGKQQRGYQDIDVLALNGTETIIVSVSSNFDDKLNFSNGKLNEEKSKKTVCYFNRVEEYLTNTENYKWTITNRKIKKIIAVINAPKNIDKFNNFLEKNKISILRIEEMISKIIEYLENNKGLKIQNQTLKIIQVLKEKGRLSIAY